MLLVGLTVLAVVLISQDSSAQHAPPVFAPGDPAQCAEIRTMDNVACTEPWVQMIAPSENPNDGNDYLLEKGDEITEMWLCNVAVDQPFKSTILALNCWSATNSCGCTATHVVSFPNWRVPVDYADEAMEYVLMPCMRYAVDLIAARDGISLTDEQKGRFIDQHMIPTQKLVIDRYVAEINDVLNDSVAQEQLGYGVLERRKVLYQEFLGKCLVGAMDGLQ